MLDTDIWEAMTKILGLADHARHRGFRPHSDEYGSVRIILFGRGLCFSTLGSWSFCSFFESILSRGDFKQLPPATSKARVLEWLEY